ncbi:MAG: hypothetical protein ACI4UM_09565 [Succinivibrio sp.]
MNLSTDKSDTQNSSLNAVSSPDVSRNEIAQALKQTESCINRYCYAHSIADITDTDSSDPKYLAVYKRLGAKVLDGSLRKASLQRAMDSRCSRMRHLLEVVLGFYKDGRLNTDLQLEDAISSAQCFKDYFMLILALRDSAHKDEKHNQLCCEYIDHFIEGEIVTLCRLIGSD